MWVYIIFIALGTYFVWTKVMKKSPMPTVPGPPGVPSLGNVHQINTDKVHLSTEELSKTYGNIFKIHLFRKPILVVSDFEALKEILVKRGNDFSGRNKNFFSDIQGYGNIITGSPVFPWWHDMKKATQVHLKGYGSGLKRLEAITVENINTSINNLANNAKCGQAVSISDELEIILANIIYSIAFDKKLESEEERYTIKKVGQMMMSITKPGFHASVWLALFPWLRFFGNHAWKVFKETLDIRHTLFKKWEAEARQELKDGKDHEANFINRILKLKEDKLGELVGEHHISQSTWTLFLAGTLTTLGTLSSLFHILVDQPDIQEKLHDEVDGVVQDRNVQVEDKANMPYHMAVIYEILRLAPVLPLLATHETLCNTEVQNHKVAKGTSVWLDVWTMQHDERHFDEPYKFRPERYLDDSGKLVLADHPNRGHLLSFGAGPRVCAGETFAMTRMFLILAQMMKRFTLLPPDHQQDPFDPRKMVNGNGWMALDFKVNLVDRS